MRVCERTGTIRKNRATNKNKKASSQPSANIMVRPQVPRHLVNVKSAPYYYYESRRQPTFRPFVFDIATLRAPAFHTSGQATVPSFFSHFLHTISTSLFVDEPTGSNRASWACSGNESARACWEILNHHKTGKHNNQVGLPRDFGRTPAGDSSLNEPRKSG